MGRSGTRSRRGFLAMCGVAAATLGGCSAAPFGQTRDRGRSQERTRTQNRTRPRNRTATDDAASTTSAASATNEWATFAYDRANTGHNPTTAAPSAERRRWESYVEGYYALPTPAVVDEAVYVGSSGKLYALDRASGEQRWTRHLGALAHEFTATVADGTVYAAGRGQADLAELESGSGVPGRMVAVDAADGREQWRRKGYVSGSPTIVDDLLYYPTNAANEGFVRAVDRADGSDRWRFAFGDGDGASAFATPAYADGTLFALGNRGSRGVLHALDPTTGDSRWRYETDATAYAAPVVADGRALVATADGTLHVVDAASGTRIWRANVGEAVQSPPAIGTDLAYVITVGEVVAVDRADGRVAWSHEIGSTHYSTTVTTPGRVVVGGPTMYAFDHAGEVQWTRQVPGFAGSYGEPAIVDGEVFAGVCIKDDSNAVYDNYVYRMS